MLIEPQASDQLRAVLQKGLRTYMPDRDAAADLFAKTAQGIRVFTIALDDVVKGTDLTHTDSAGWRFLATVENQGAMAVDVVNPDNREATVASLSRHRLIAEAIASWEKLRNSEIAKREDLELRILRIPGMLTEAFWLKAADGRHFIVPYLVPDPALRVLHPYTLADFLDAARPIAERFVSADDGDRVDAAQQM